MPDSSQQSDATAVRATSAWAPLTTPRNGTKDGAPLLKTPGPAPTRKSPSGPPTILVRSLVKRYPLTPGWRSIFRGTGEKIALDEIDLEIHPGEIFGLLGPNGAGKTTLVKILSTLLLPTSGTALVAGIDVVENSLDVRTQIGLVHGDERTFFWRLSVYENLRFYASLYNLSGRDADRRITEVLELVDLASAAHERMDRLSSGMKQRAAIARGLLSDPKILLMDEPTRNLDPIGAHEVRSFIRDRIVASGRTVLLATNLMAEAEEICDRVALLNKGSIILAGTIDELRSVVQFDQVHTLLVSNIARDRLVGLSTIPSVCSVTVEPAGDGMFDLQLGVDLASSAVPEAIRRITQDGGSVWSSTPRELSLDEIFRLVIGGHRTGDRTVKEEVE